MKSRPVDRAVTAELLAKYDRPGPRYTSYPTSVEFGTGVNAGTYAQRLEAADTLGDAPLSLYVHLPFCDERCTFCGCHVIISPDHVKAKPYLELLEREIELVAARLPHRRRFSQLHLGGGTPTYHSPEELDRLLRVIERSFRPAKNAELAIEVDPRVTTREHLALLAEHGFNRVSLGVQDFTPAVQEAAGRVQSVEETAALIEDARELGYGGINVDLIYGLPLQELEGFERTVEKVIELGADRAAIYSFAYVPWIRGNQRSISEDDLPSRELKFALFALARERFLAAGYEPIGMDHFAKPGDELARARSEGRLRRNFQGYTVIPASDVIGLGISAIGDVRGIYAQNAKKLSDYRKALEAGELPVERGILRTREDELRRQVIHELMCNFSVDTGEIERRFGIDFAATFAEDLRLLSEHEREGMVTIDPERIAATPIGELFVRNLARCFDAHWRDKHEGREGSVFSRTV